jgi:hypothetical protein
VMDAAATGEDSKQIFLALGQHFALQGQVDLFATGGLKAPRFVHVESVRRTLARRVDFATMSDRP